MGITWIASYPKSGNTWVRLFLDALLEGNGECPDLSSWDFAPQLARSRECFENFLHVDASDLTEAELQNWRPTLTRALASALPSPTYMKTHDARLSTADGEPLVPPDATAAAVYLVRDPRDIAPSLAHHLDCDLDRAISIMADPNWITPSHRRGLNFPLGDLWSTWSTNVESWLDAEGPQPLVLHFESLLSDPQAAFTKLADYLGIATDARSIDAAINATRFHDLQVTEQRNGFAGQVAPGRIFFREGREGGWRSTLSAAQVTRIETDHGRVMRRLGYLRKVAGPDMKWTPDRN
jgi:aryl sulfotransferase